MARRCKRRASSSANRDTNYNASDAGERDANAEDQHASDVGDRDANAEDQHGHDTADEQEREVQASQPPSRRQRRRKVVKWPSDQIHVKELTEDGFPTEEVALRRMRKLAGLIARERLKLTMPSFDELDEEERGHLFDEYVQPKLKFDDHLRDTACMMIMRVINHAWKTYKSELVRKFVCTGLDARVKHPYIPHEEWEDFEKLQQSAEAKKRREKFQKLRARNKHNHCLGTAGYAGAFKKWAKEDRYLASKGISNPWHKYPPGRSRSYLRGRSKLVLSESSAEIQWGSKSTERVSQQVVEKQAEIESLGRTDMVRDKDVLTQVLGPEQTGRIRGFSSYSGWEYWPDCSNMYRKRKRSDVDVEALKDELREEVHGEVHKAVTTFLREHGINLVLPSNTLPSVGGKSSCASTSDAVCNNVELDGPDGNLYPNPLDHVREAECTLVSNPGSYQVEVAKGTAFPQQKELYSVPVQDGFIVVLVDFVYLEHESFVLNPPSTSEITTLGDAMHKRVQWRKDCIVISPKVHSKSSLERSWLGGLAKTSLNDIVCSGSSSNLQNVKSAPTVRNCASKEHAEGRKQTNKSTRGLAGSSTAFRAPVSNTKQGQQVQQGASKEHAEDQKQTNKSTRGPAACRAPKSNTKQCQQVGVNQQQQGHLTKSSTTSSESPLWIRPNSKFNFVQPMLSEELVNAEPQPNSKFNFGQLMLPEEELVNAGPGCADLHALYMNACAENRNTGIVGRIKRDFFWRENESEPLTMRFEDLFNLLKLDALDVGILRVITLYLIVLARQKSVPVGLLDPDALSISALRRDRAYSVAYLERCLMKYVKEKYVMFAYYSGRHWIAVVIVPSWDKVLYIDSNRGMKTDLSRLISVIDEAYGNFQDKVKKGRTKFKLQHATKVPCKQQGPNNRCGSGFFAAHNLMCMLVQTGAEDSKDLDLSTTEVCAEEIRTQIADFILDWIVEPNGQFHSPQLAANEQYDDE